MKKVISALLAFILVLGIALPVSAEIVYEEVVGEQRVSVGANLTDDQKATVYSHFGIERGSVNEVVVTIDDERSYLEGVIDESKMGTRSLSSIFITLLKEGSGLDITLHNINWLTKSTYENALITVGITDAKIIIASPVAVSGTAALTGIYKSFEDITGEEIDETAKDVATEELVTTGELADEIGSDEASALVNEIKLASDDLANMDDDKAKKEINNIAVDLNINLNDAQLDKLLSLARSFENIDLSQVKGVLENVSNKFNNLLDIDTGGFWNAIKNFFIGIKDWIVGLFTGGNKDEDNSSQDESQASSNNSSDSSSSTVSSEASDDVNQTDSSQVGENTESSPEDVSIPDFEAPEAIE